MKSKTYQYYILLASKKEKYPYLVCDASKPAGEKVVAKFKEEKHANDFKNRLEIDLGPSEKKD